MGDRNLNADLTSVMADGACCAWRPGYRPNAGQLAYERMLDLIISDALEAMGYDQTAVITQDGGVRRLELLGPDSPGEMVYEYRPVARDGTPEALEAMRLLAVSVREFIVRQGEVTDGQYDVPRHVGEISRPERHRQRWRRRGLQHRHDHRQPSLSHLHL